MKLSNLKKTSSNMSKGKRFEIFDGIFATILPNMGSKHRFSVGYKVQKYMIDNNIEKREDIPKEVFERIAKEAIVDTIIVDIEGIVDDKTNEPIKWTVNFGLSLIEDEDLVDFFDKIYKISTNEKAFYEQDLNEDTKKVIDIIDGEMVLTKDKVKADKKIYDDSLKREGTGRETPTYKLYKRMIEAKQFYNIECINNDLNFLDRERDYIIDSMSGNIIVKPLKYETIKNYIELGLSEFLNFNKNGKDNDFIKKYIKFIIELDDYIIMKHRNNKNGK